MISTINNIRYEGEIWASSLKEYDAAILELLTSKDCLIVLSHGDPPYKAVLGVPHQAAVGEPYICGRGKKRSSDENAASFALVAFSLLKEHDMPCKLVIMAHSTGEDPNKVLSSPYCSEIFQGATELLFECHGASNDRDHDLELSAGRNERSNPIEFGRSLHCSLQHCYDLAVQEKPGEHAALVLLKGQGEKNGRLQNPGTGTTSLIEADNRGIPALHLEAKPKFRKTDGNKDIVSSDGLVLGQAIAQTILRRQATKQK
jgi:hypothetical protein